MRKLIATEVLSTPMHIFPIIKLNNTVCMASQFSPMYGKTLFYLWKGKKDDDLERSRSVYKLTEAGFSNIMRYKDVF